MRFDPLLDPPGKTDWARLRRMTEADIQAAIASDPDAAPEWTAEDFASAKVILPPPKQAISIRIDREVLDWFKALGPGYQTRMNMILRGYMERHRETPDEPST